MDASALVKRHGSITKAAKASGVSRYALARQLRKAAGGESTPRRKTLADFREEYDKSYYVPKKIKAALAALGSAWDYEVELSRMAGVSLVDLGLVREQFADHIVKIGREGRRAWCGNKAMAAQMRSMV